MIFSVWRNTYIVQKSKDVLKNVSTQTVTLSSKNNQNCKFLFSVTISSSSSGALHLIYHGNLVICWEKLSCYCCKCVDFCDYARYYRNFLHYFASSNNIKAIWFWYNSMLLLLYYRQVAQFDNCLFGNSIWYEKSIIKIE